uniref:endo-polygalacturonase n=1 Tax=Lygus lineolaris TaxID=50650 RepID=A0A126CVV1_LYGLI|nr:polygalacturonase 4a [Lygus lineolaris]
MISSVGVLCTIYMLGIASGFDLTNFNQLNQAKQQNLIRVVNLQVPAGVTLDLTKLKDGTTVEFVGRTTFGYQEWDGPMVKISGKKLIIKGAAGNLLDGEGRRWWNGKGGPPGKRKPRMFEAIVEQSVITGLNFKNPPQACFVCNWCKNVRIDHVNVDARDGRGGLAKNTDGFGIGFAKNVNLTDCNVYNQDDCFVTGAGEDILVERLTCEGGNGISIGTLGGGAVVQRVTVRNSKIIDNLVGVNVKTGHNKQGALRDITFENIELVGIQQFGISVHGNENHPQFPGGEPTPLPIENLTIKNVWGTLNGPGGANIWVWVAPGSAKNWKWSSNVKGGKSAMFRPPLQCKGIPAGLNIPCAEK